MFASSRWSDSHSRFRQRYVKVLECGATLDQRIKTRLGFGICASGGHGSSYACLRGTSAKNDLRVASLMKAKPEACWRQSRPLMNYCPGRIANSRFTKKNCRSPVSLARANTDRSLLLSASQPNQSFFQSSYGPAFLPYSSWLSINLLKKGNYYAYFGIILLLPSAT